VKYHAITISGPICSGKSSLFKTLCQKLGWLSYSASQFFRDFCQKNNLPLFAANLRPVSLTRKVDQEMRKKLLAGENLILEGWLAGFIARLPSPGGEATGGQAQGIPGVLKVLLICEDGERAKRFAKREKISLQKAFREIRKREGNLFGKWGKVYGRRDFFEPKFYDLVIDTTRLKPKEPVDLVLKEMGRPVERKIRAVTVDGLVIKKGKILLVRRNHEPYFGFWAIPGGYVEYGETCEQAVLREVREETGLETKIKKFLGVYSAPSRDPRQTIAIAYLLDVKGGKVEKSDEATDIGWFNFDDLPSLAFDHREVINDYLKNFLK